MEKEYMNKLIQLRNLIETGYENWDRIVDLDSYFTGNRNTCKCKRNTSISNLNNYWNNNKHKLEQ